MEDDSIFIILALLITGANSECTLKIQGPFKESLFSSCYILNKFQSRLFSSSLRHGCLQIYHIMDPLPLPSSGLIERNSFSLQIYGDWGLLTKGKCILSLFSPSDRVHVATIRLDVLDLIVAYGPKALINCFVAGRSWQSLVLDNLLYTFHSFFTFIICTLIQGSIRRM